MLKYLINMRPAASFSKTVFAPFIWLLVMGIGAISPASVSEKEKGFEVSLYTGIPGIGHLGDSYKSITENSKIPFTSIDVTDDPELLKAGIVYGISFDSVGAKVYFKRGGSCMISVHPPFNGNVKSTQIQVFDMDKPAQLRWEDVLFKELGQPNAQGGGGLFGGDVYFYPWGDIEVSRIGLRQLMLYRDRAISEYRRNNASKGNIKFFK